MLEAAKRRLERGGSPMMEASCGEWLVVGRDKVSISMAVAASARAYSMC